jgi:soluble lytic murein transglycosylase-like protein
VTARSEHGAARTAVAALVIALAATAAVAATADTLTDGTQPPTRSVFTYTEPDGTPVFADHVPAGQAYGVKTFACYACNPNSNVDWQRTGLHTDKYNSIISTAAAAYQVDPALVRALIHAESNFDPAALSHKGAQGLMQLMPGTARDLGVRDVWSASENIDAGVRYLAQLLTRYAGNENLATAAYNAGPESVTRHGGIPPYPETQVYVDRVRILRDRYRSAHES